MNLFLVFHKDPKMVTGKACQSNFFIPLNLQLCHHAKRSPTVEGDTIQHPTIGYNLPILSKQLYRVEEGDKGDSSLFYQRCT